MFLRRRGDLKSVIRQLGGELFARGGAVDSYFNLKGCDAELRAEDGTTLRCFLPKGHGNAHESVEGGCQWIGNDAFSLVSEPAPIKTGDNFEGVNFEWWSKVTPELIHKRLAARNIGMDNDALWRIRARIESHIRGGPEREAALLKSWWDGYKEWAIVRHTRSESSLKDALIAQHCKVRD